MWEETLTFTVHMPEIALVRFLVWDHDPIGRDFVGQRTVTFSSLVPGRCKLAFPLWIGYSFFVFVCFLLWKRSISGLLYGGLLVSL